MKMMIKYFNFYRTVNDAIPIKLINSYNNEYINMRNKNDNHDL